MKKIKIALIIVLVGIIAYSGVQIFKDQKDSKADNIYEGDYETTPYVLCENIETTSEETISESSVVTSNATTEWKQANANVVCTVSINGLNNEPVVNTGKNQNEYLYKDINGNYNKNGTLFTAYGSELGKTNVTTIFGHSMKSGQKFGTLNKFKNLDYVKENPVFTLTDEYSDILVKIVGVCDVSSNYKKNNWYYADPNQSVESFVKQFRNRSYFVIPDKAPSDGKYVILSTCDYSFENERLIIVGRIMDSSEINTKDYRQNQFVQRAVEYYETHNVSAPSAEQLSKNYSANYGKTS